MNNIESAKLKTKFYDSATDRATVNSLPHFENTKNKQLCKTS